ncbi:MAG: hypothetical protein Ta2B_04390 [Termitinemataceae bacterium]|nr:MAG: hypothetical protein Ta2B_04390 [Termitinemataceae bacterium]
MPDNISMLFSYSDPVKTSLRLATLSTTIKTTKAPIELSTAFAGTTMVLILYSSEALSSFATMLPLILANVAFVTRTCTALL